MDFRRIGLASIPGLVLYVLLYIFWIVSGQGFDPFMNWEDPVQTLNSDVLSEYPAQALLGQHAQPPLFMSIKLLGLQFGDQQVLFWQTLWFVSFAVGLTAIVGSLLVMGLSVKLTAVLAVTYVVLPGTAKYALWGYTTVLVSTLLALIVYGFALVWTHSRWGVPLVAISTVLLVTLRSYFIWAIGLVLLSLVVYRLTMSRKLRTRPLQWTFVVVAFLAVIGVQYHYWSSFGLTSMSSLGPGNLNRGLLAVGLTEEEKALLAARDLCLADVIASGPFSSAEGVPSCRELWIERNLHTTKAAELAETGNSLGRLQGAFAQQYFFVEAIKTFPTAPLRQLKGSDVADGALGSYLGTTAGLTGMALGIQAFFPILSFLTVVVAGGLLIVSGGARFTPGWVWIAVSLLAFQTFASVWGEYPENLRIRAEGHSLLFLVPVLLVVCLHISRQRTKELASPQEAERN